MTSVTSRLTLGQRRLIGVVMDYATALVDAWASLRRPAGGNRRLDLPGTFAVEVSNDLITRLTIRG